MSAPSRSDMRSVILWLHGIDQREGISPATYFSRRKRISERYGIDIATVPPRYHTEVVPLGDDEEIPF